MKKKKENMTGSFWGAVGSDIGWSRRKRKEMSTGGKAMDVTSGDRSQPRLCALTGTSQVSVELSSQLGAPYMKMSPCQGSFHQISYNLFPFFSFSANEDCLDFGGDALQRDTRAPLLAEARVAVQFATLPCQCSLHTSAAAVKVRAALASSTPDT